MKLRRRLSGVLFGLGCALTFIGLLALILPSVANDQLRLVLASFEAPSDHLAVRLINSGMSFALHNGWQVLFVGTALLVTGLVLFILFSHEKKAAPKDETYRRPAAGQTQPLWEQQPLPASERVNPFADMALWDQQFAPARQQIEDNPFPAFGGPMLELNRVEEEFAAAFPPDIYARPAEVEQVYIEQTDPETLPIETPEPDFKAASEPVQLYTSNPSESLLTSAPLKPLQQPTLHSPVPEPEIPEKSEPVYTPNEESDAPVQISSRIRSTMGRHREW